MSDRPPGTAPDRHDRAPDHDHDHDHEHDAPGVRGWLRHVLTPHTHDPGAGFDSALESSHKGVFAVKVSLAALMLTAVVQLALVWLTSSTALLADTIHNFSDALTSVPLWIAFVIGRRAASRTYTYGYGRAEDLAGLFVVGMIAFSAVLVGWESLQRLIEPAEVSNLGLLAAAGVVGFVGNELVAIYRIRVGNEIGSQALVADGLHARTDGLTSIAVVVAAAGVWLGFPLADPIIGLVITAAILWILRDAARSVFRRLMDAVDLELVEDIERVAASVDGVMEVETVQVRWVGHRLRASVTLVVDCQASVADGHHIAEHVRHALFHEVGRLDAVLVHVDPCDCGAMDAHAHTREHDETLPPRRGVPAGLAGD
ncbi:MAG: cation diffusion facilitator family transporter [Candidatus Limnocylindrales bacterium]